MAELFHIRADNSNWIDFTAKELRFNAIGFQINEEAAKELWLSFPGDDENKLNECAKFAQSIGVRDIGDFCGKIFLMVKNSFPAINIKKKTDSSSEKAFRLFAEFLEEQIAIHEKHPMPEKYYEQKFGLRYEDFIIGLKNVLKFARDDNEMVIMLNSIVPEYGEKLFSEWLLEQRGIKRTSQLAKKIASLKKRFKVYLEYGGN